MSTFFGPAVSMTLGLLLAGANVLLIRYVGAWCIWTGAVGLAAFAAAAGATLAGWTRQRLMLTDLLLATTLLTFNIWAFSHLGNLLLYLGLFFFVLFGLIMGGALFRFLTMLAPMPKTVVYVTGWGFVLISWAGALVLEASYFPADCYDAYAHGLVRLTDEETAEQARVRVMRQAQERLTSLHRAGGTLAYLKWALTQCKISFEIPGATGTVDHKLAQGRRGFAARLVLSLGLLSVAVLSQLRPLVRKQTPVADDEVAAPEAVKDLRFRSSRQ